MPRKAKRTETYANRTDLQKAPVTAAPDQAYGERGQQEAAQGEMPMAGSGPSSFDDVLAAAQAQPFEPIPLAAPSGRPFESVTAGLSSGPGPGPEVLRKPGSRASDVLTTLADRLGVPELQLMAERARSRGR